MSKSDFIKSLAGNLGISIAEANRYFKLTNETILAYLKDNPMLRVPDFGTYAIKISKPRELINPKTGVKIKVPAKKVMSFKASSKVKELLNES